MPWTSALNNLLYGLAWEAFDESEDKPCQSPCYSTNSAKMQECSRPFRTAIRQHDDWNNWKPGIHVRAYHQLGHRPSQSRLSARPVWYSCRAPPPADYFGTIPIACETGQHQAGDNLQSHHEPTAALPAVPRHHFHPPIS